jgi:phage anti-repressor protein
MEVEKMNELVELKKRFEAIAQSTEEFPVDFDEAWVWIGYARKDSALRTLQTNFDQSIDFNFHRDVEVKEGLDFDSTGLWNQKTGRGGDRRTIRYFLTVDCFKSFCMMAGTPKGKEVRRYYIQIEKAWNTPEAVAARARQMGINLQPEPIAWCPYPFFNQLNAEGVLGKLIETCDKGYCSVEEFKRVVFSKPDATPYKSPQEAPNVAYAKAVTFLRGDSRKMHPDIAAFVEASLAITGSGDDFLLVREVYERYSAQKENPISRPMFSRHLRLIYPEIGHKQKKVNGSAELIFYGVKLKEHDQR